MKFSTRAGLPALSHLLFALVFTVALPQCSLAQPLDGPPPHDAPRLEMLTELLDLNTSQIELLKQTDHALPYNQLYLQALHRQLFELANSDLYSQAEATILINDIGQAVMDELTAKSIAQNAFYNSLTAEQKATLASLPPPRNGKRPL